MQESDFLTVISGYAEAEALLAEGNSNSFFDESEVLEWLDQADLLYKEEDLPRFYVKEEMITYCRDKRRMWTAEFQKRFPENRLVSSRGLQSFILADFKDGFVESVRQDKKDVVLRINAKESLSRVDSCELRFKNAEFVVDGKKAENVFAPQFMLLDLKELDARKNCLCIAETAYENTADKPIAVFYLDGLIDNAKGIKGAQLILRFDDVIFENMQLRTI